MSRANQFLKIPLAGNWPGFSGGTILMSIRPDWDASEANMPEPTFWALYYDASNYWKLEFVKASDKFRFVMYDGTATNIESAAQTFSKGDKILLIATWDDTNGDLWTNGVQSATGTKTQRDITLPDSLVTYDPQNSRYANSVIDEFAIFDQPFTQRMVDHVYDELFSKGKPLLKAGFLG